MTQGAHCFPNLNPRKVAVVLFTFQNQLHDGKLTLKYVLIVQKGAHRYLMNTNTCSYMIHRMSPGFAWFKLDKDPILMSCLRLIIFLCSMLFILSVFDMVALPSDSLNCTLKQSKCRSVLLFLSFLPNFTRSLYVNPRKSYCGFKSGIRYL